MKFKNIEVMGIQKVVINQKTCWTRASEGRGGWTQTKETPTGHEKWSWSHAEMCRMLNALKADRRYRMWVHHDTLNIVSREVTVRVVDRAVKWTPESLLGKPYVPGSLPYGGGISSKTGKVVMVVDANGKIHDAPRDSPALVIEPCR